MSESAPVTPSPRRFDPRGALRHRWLVLLGGLALLLVAASVSAFVLLRGEPAVAPPLELAPQAQLDRRWGTYLSEREWGNPREAIGNNGWGLSWRGAIDTEYNYSDDGIAGLTDRDNEFRIGWAFWDGRQEHVTERLLGVSNPQGENGEAITDDRVFNENTPSGSYSRLRYSYPPEERTFDIQLETAKYDSNRMVLTATVTNSGSMSRQLDVVLKGWLAPGGEVQPLVAADATAGGGNDGLLLVGEQSSVAIVGRPPAGWQISAEKGALNENLRDGLESLTQGDGHIGALVYRLRLTPNETQTVRLAIAEGQTGNPAGLAATARDLLEQATALTGARRSEARALFDDVAAYPDLYRQALMSLLWNQSYYRWDGTSGVNPSWSGLVDAHDVLIMPDKWEFPWPASWDQAFHALTAALVDATIAQDQLRFLLSERWQQPDGHIPCAEWVMDMECPPIFAWSAWRVYETTRDREFLAEIYPALQRHYDYWWQNLLVNDGLFTGGFLGMDNLPRSTGRAQADASAWMALFARDMARIASELRDPATERYWIDRGRIQEAINSKLWDEESGFYYDLGPGDRFIQPKSYSGLIPLIAGVVPPERLPPILEALRDEEQFLSVAGIRSMSAESPLYRPGTGGRGVNSNWRGPVWVPINYMLIRALQDVDPGLAADLRDRVVVAVEADWRTTGRFREHFHGDTGEGLGADAQAGWTALVANLIHESWPRPAAD
ncbi:MAG TPA: trehalase family glycosidase [Candidatus Limnocylindria bacterium]|nr:trehalase family glycosidase [Candidatus Limnocylindria bacterium]